jgi:hypothetical protein
MADELEVLQRVELALAQSKRVRREAGISVVQLARLRDTLQPDTPAQGEIEENAITEDRP